MGGAWPERGVPRCLGRSLEWGRGFSQGVGLEVGHGRTCGWGGPWAGGACPGVWWGRALGSGPGGACRGLEGPGSVNGGGAGRLREDFSLRARRAVTRGQTTEVTNAQRGEATPVHRFPQLPGLLRPHVPPRPLPHEGYFPSPYTEAPLTPLPPPQAQLRWARVQSHCGVAPQGGLRHQPRGFSRPRVPAPRPRVSSNHVPLPVPSRAARAPLTR